VTYSMLLTSFVHGIFGLVCELQTSSAYELAIALLVVSKRVVDLSVMNHYQVFVN
jgi:hypothetical protein